MNKRRNLYRLEKSIPTYVARYSYTCTINCSSRLLQKFKLWTPVLNLLFNSMLFLSQFCRCFGALGYHTTCRSGRQMRILFPSLSCPRNTRKVQKKEIILNKRTNGLSDHSYKAYNSRTVKNVINEIRARS